MAMAQTIPPSGGSPITTLTYSLDKERLVDTTAIGFVRAIASHPSSGDLYVFTENAPRTVWALDVSTGSFNPLYDEASLPTLETYESYATTLIGPAAAQPGFLVIGKPWRPWHEGTPASQASAPDSLLVLRDQDLDGVFDETVELTWAEYRARGYFDHEIVEYP